MILGLESSCDETAVALFDPSAGLQGEWVASQVARHAPFGGVVPDLASREHLEAFGPLLAEVWRRGPPASITRVAVTAGPGLAACLALGVSVARALGLALGRPVEPVHHLRAHLWSVFIPEHARDPRAWPEVRSTLFPHLALLVSGGNSAVVAFEADGVTRVLAETGDDAAGEALDKGAKLLGLGYPGGPAIEQAAARGQAGAFPFPRAVPAADDRRFSFSGLKTALRYQIEALGPAETERRRDDLCASYQAAVIEQLVRKLSDAGDGRRWRSVGLSGGVANNRALRAALSRWAADRGLPLLAARPSHTGDNAAMVAFAAWADHPTAASGAEAAAALVQPAWEWPPVEGSA